MNMRIEVVPQLEDNYCYLVHPRSDPKRVFVIDPSEPGRIMDHLASQGIEGGVILNTHHHADHTQGNLELKARLGFRVAASAQDQNRIPGVDIALEGSGETRLLDTPIGFMRSPGHTRSHLVFNFFETGDVFTGDTLFLLGCGRLFEGQAHELYESLQILARLPPSTRLWCGHEYTLKNLEFAESVLGTGDANLAAVGRKYRSARELGQPTMPGLLADELAANPFFRCHEPELRRKLRLPAESSAVEVFTQLRKLRDHF